MERLININCVNCGEGFTTEPFFYNTSVVARHNPVSGTDYHVARTFAKAVCPNCGEVNTPVCECDIYESDIIDLAIRRHKRG